MQSVFTLGRQPALGLAEFESLYGAKVITPLGKQAALVDVEPGDVDFARLGGSTRLCKLITTPPTTDWQQIAEYIAGWLPEHIATIPEGKIRLGLTYFGAGVSLKTLNATGLALKKVIKASGRSVRVVPNTAAELNTAQIIHNQLTGSTGLELVIIIDGKRSIIAQTITTQDIEAYAARDQRRPKRDARVGMLPPKLAQIIINLAGKHPSPKDGSPATLSHPVRLLDPFCGTGVILQEAMLIGYHAYGTDLESRMIDYSHTNLEWFTRLPQFKPHDPTFNLEQGDATTHTWRHPFDLIACETYLGRPLSSQPTPEKLAEIIADCDTIHRKFLQNLARQTAPGFRACIAVPAWKTKTGFRHLKTLENLGELGYNRLRFAHVDNRDLLYHRPDQQVARELVVLERK